MALFGLFLRLVSCNRWFGIGGMLNKVVSRNVGAGMHKMRAITKSSINK